MPQDSTPPIVCCMMMHDISHGGEQGPATNPYKGILKTMETENCNVTKFKGHFCHSYLFWWVTLSISKNLASSHLITGSSCYWSSSRGGFGEVGQGSHAKWSCGADRTEWSEFVDDPHSSPFYFPAEKQHYLKPWSRRNLNFSNSHLIKAVVFEPHSCIWVVIHLV